VSLLQAGEPLQSTMPQVCCPIREHWIWPDSRQAPQREGLCLRLEDSVDSDVCANCLSAECDWNTCTPPVENFLFQESSKSFVEDGMWDMVSEAKSSNPPLSKELLLQTHETEEDYWGKDGGEHHEDSDGGEEEDSN